MKKLLVLIVVISFALTAIPVFAAEKAESASGQKTETKSFFQQASDDISKMKVHVSDKSATKIFQESGDKIEAGCPDAKTLSLRGKKAELEKRRTGRNILLL